MYRNFLSYLMSSEDPRGSAPANVSTFMYLFHPAKDVRSLTSSETWPDTEYLPAYNSYSSPQSNKPS